MDVLVFFSNFYFNKFSKTFFSLIMITMLLNFVCIHMISSDSICIFIRHPHQTSFQFVSESHLESLQFSNSPHAIPSDTQSVLRWCIDEILQPHSADHNCLWIRNVQCGSLAAAILWCSNRCPSSTCNTRNCAAIFYWYLSHSHIAGIVSVEGRTCMCRAAHRICVN